MSTPRTQLLASAAAPDFEDARVAGVFASIPLPPRRQLLAVRSLIFEVAAKTPEVGRILETLKWGEPSYLTPETGAGTTIRLNWREAPTESAALFVHCQTDLVERYRLRHADVLSFEGSRAVVLPPVDAPLPEDALRDCIRLALTYHLAKR